MWILLTDLITSTLPFISNAFVAIFAFNEANCLVQKFSSFSLGKLCGKMMKSATSIATPRRSISGWDHWESSAVRSTARKHLPICRQRPWGLCPSQPLHFNSLHCRLITSYTNYLSYYPGPSCSLSSSSSSFFLSPHQVVAMGGNSIPLLFRTVPFQSPRNRAAECSVDKSSFHSEFPRKMLVGGGGEDTTPPPPKYNLICTTHGCIVVVVVVVVMAASIRLFLLFLALPNCIQVIVVKHTKLPQCVCAIFCHSTTTAAPSFFSHLHPLTSFRRPGALQRVFYSGYTLPQGIKLFNSETQEILNHSNASDCN